jgi:hypothetical protein
MGKCKNCGKEMIGDDHCQDCKIAHLSLEVDKEKGARKSLSRWFVVAIVLLVVLGLYVLMR